MKKKSYGLQNCSIYNFNDKVKCVDIHIAYMLNRTQSMFKYEGLPDTIPQRILELFIQTNGNVCFYKHEDNLYVFTGGLGGEPDVYYMPTIYTIANPALNISKNLKIDEDCVVIPNDSLYIGMMPLYRRYATALMENELSMKVATINLRLTSLITAPDDRTKVSAEKYLRDIEEGKQGIIAENAFLDGLRVQPYSTSGSTNYITNLIEHEQYLKASWYNDIGINANYNMKRESLNSDESQLNNDALLPLVDDMLNCRKIGLEKVNNMFGTNISVDFNSSWEDNIEELEAAQDNLENPEIPLMENEEGDEDARDEKTE